jgi:hypothetical protein
VRLERGDREREAIETGEREAPLERDGREREREACEKETGGSESGAWE